MVINNVVKLFYHQDHLGTTDYLSDNVAGDVASYVTYDDWGSLSNNKAILMMGKRQLDLVQDYTGHAYDMVLGVYYAKARMYDADDRRFMAVDPVGGYTSNPQTITQYTYCLNNPTLYTDPTGELAYPGQIHGWILKRIVSQNTDLSKERWMTLPALHIGRVDLVDIKTGDIYELKPETWSIKNAEAQLNMYTTGTFMAQKLKALKPHIGTGVTHNLCGNFPQDIYDIQYKYIGNGIITYTYEINKERLKQQLKETGVAVTETAIATILAILAAAAAAAGLPATS
jgi:RHS repeat-associated protein